VLPDFLAYLNSCKEASTGTIENNQNWPGPSSYKSKLGDVTELKVSFHTNEVDAVRRTND
jgi:hypothetical protein